jgi:hypothetical protein
MLTRGVSTSGGARRGRAVDTNPCRGYRGRWRSGGSGRRRCCGERKSRPITRTWAGLSSSHRTRSGSISKRLPRADRTAFGAPASRRRMSRTRGRCLPRRRRACGRPGPSCRAGPRRRSRARRVPRRLGSRPTSGPHAAGASATRTWTLAVPPAVVAPMTLRVAVSPQFRAVRQPADPSIRGWPRGAAITRERTRQLRGPLTTGRAP